MNKAAPIDASTTPRRHRVTFVTGPSGAGRSTAIEVLEDLGCEAIDNMPLSLVPRLLSGPVSLHALALGTDTRNRDFSADALVALIQSLRERDDVALSVLYLDCTDDELVRRYSSTRRRHPAAPGDTPETGIAQEKNLLRPVRDLADTLIDTSELSVHDLRGRIEDLFGLNKTHSMAVTIQSFSYKRGLPQGLDMAFDVRFLRNPYWDPSLRHGTGLLPEVQDYVADDIRFAPFFQSLLDLILPLLPAFKEEGKSHLSIGFGCTGGQHRSVTVAERLAVGLEDQNWKVTVRHREMERRTIPEAIPVSRKGAKT